MSLYKRGRNYSISLWVDGVRHLKSTGTTSRREAEGIERQIGEQIVGEHHARLAGTMRDPERARRSERGRARNHHQVRRANAAPEEPDGVQSDGSFVEAAREW